MAFLLNQPADLTRFVKSILRTHFAPGERGVLALVPFPSQFIGEAIVNTNPLYADERSARAVLAEFEEGKGGIVHEMMAVMGAIDHDAGMVDLSKIAATLGIPVDPIVRFRVIPKVVDLGTHMVLELFSNETHKEITESTLMLDDDGSVQKGIFDFIAGNRKRGNFDTYVSTTIPRSPTTAIYDNPSFATIREETRIGSVTVLSLNDDLSYTLGG